MGRPSVRRRQPAIVHDRIGGGDAPHVALGV